MRFGFLPFLLGAMFAVIPLILHLLFQRRGPRVYFPTLRFLNQCVRKTARRRRIENLLLLVARMALLGLLAMALAEPLIPSRLASTGSRDTVVILDNSYSMGTRQFGAERFRAAKEIAADLLRQSPRVALIVTSGSESQRPVVLAPADNDMRSLVSNCRLFAGKADVTAALAKAYNVLADSGSTSGQIFVISDLQANSFPTPDDRLPTDRVPDVPVIVYDCGQGAVRNVALVGLEARGGLGVAGSAVELIADVLNSSDSPVKDIPVTVYLAGKPVIDKRVSLDGRSHAKVSFTVPLGSGSVQTGWVQLPPDSLDLDNRLNFRMGLRDRINVLLVRDEQASIASLDESFFLARALDPRPGAASSDSPIRPNVILSSSLSRDSLAGQAVVCLLNVRSLDDDAVLALVRYVRAGGNLFILPGDRVTPEAYVRLISPERPEALLQVRLLGPLVPTGRTGGGYWKVVPVDFSHPFLAKFKSLGAPIFERITVTQFHVVSVPSGSPVQVLANLVPQEPAVGE